MKRGPSIVDLGAKRVDGCEVDDHMSVDEMIDAIDRLKKNAVAPMKCPDCLRGWYVVADSIPVGSKTFACSCGALVPIEPSVGLAPNGKVLGRARR